MSDYQFEPTFQQRLDRLNISDSELLEILEAGWWALNKRMSEVGEHLDLSDWYLAELAAKSTKLQNDSDFWEDITEFSINLAKKGGVSDGVIPFDNPQGSPE
jgi:hypothetical protein